MIRNVHERELAVPAGVAGALLDTAGGPDDAIWPVPAWPALVLDRPLRAGSAGGHGPIRYRVSAYEPGRMLECTFAPRMGLEGTHTFVVESLGSDACRLRHEIRGRARGSGRVIWPLAVRWLHDALLEDLFDRVERRLGTGPASPARWSPWVRLLRRVFERPVAHAVDVRPGGCWRPRWTGWTPPTRSPSTSRTGRRRIHSGGRTGCSATYRSRSSP